ncbi:MAG TPA: putrescine/spermidine ABC transporter, partial [Comamonas denitrificans]|nr:putrescine/spermidine ABC transporter [Comamonas denitrificans]
LEFVVALISFGALTAFSFVNLSVISSYGFRDGRLKRPKDVWQFFVLPLLGFASIGALWLEVEETSLKAGISWAAVGLIYLGWLTKGFRRAAPQLHEEDFER